MGYPRGSFSIKIGTLMKQNWGGVTFDKLQLNKYFLLGFRTSNHNNGLTSEGPEAESGKWEFPPMSAQMGKVKLTWEVAHIVFL